MTSFVTRTAGAPRPRSARKTPCAHLSRLDVEARCTADVLLRVLGLLARQGFRPLTIAATIEGNTQRISIEMDTLSDRGAELLVACVQGLVDVREARLG